MNEKMTGNLSSYCDSLSSEARERYLDKIRLINNLDPFSSDLGEPIESIPPVDACDLISYLVLQTSFLTSKQFKARKSLEAYNQFVCGWVKDVQTWKIGDKFLTTGRVRHSQSLRAAPLSCWIIIEQKGEVNCGHCTCMAGLSETCTHVAAVLFYLEASARIQGSLSCTQAECKWIIPSYLEEVEYRTIEEIDFTSADRKKRQLNQSIQSEINSLVTHSKKAKTKCNDSPRLPIEDLDMFYKSLSNCDTMPAILSLIPLYSDRYVPKTLLQEYPKPLQSLFDPKYMELEYPELLSVSESIEVIVNLDMAKLVEKETVKQSRSNLWFMYRAGRVTASKMKSVCTTDVSNPSQRLIKTICYPEAFCFKSNATSWGCTHEKAAQNMYLKHTTSKHSDLKVTDSGLVINPQWSHIAASPDGWVDCTCCGSGVIEIKCPFCHKGDTIEDAAVLDKQFCLKTDSSGLHLDKKHAYYYQIQTQLHICDVEFCDFVLCTFPQSSQEDMHLHIERITKDTTLWHECVEKATHFFRICILPELLGKWYTHAKSPRDALNDSALHQPSALCTNERPICYCQGPEEGKMIGCDNPNCKIEWFHFACLKITEAPKGKRKWYCPDCRILPEFNRSKKKIV